MSAPDIAKIESSRIQEKIKLRAQETRENPHQIIQSVSDELSIENAGNLPSIQNQKRFVRSQRKSDGSAGKQSSIEDVMNSK